MHGLIQKEIRAVDLPCAGTGWREGRGAGNCYHIKSRIHYHLALSPRLLLKATQMTSLVLSTVPLLLKATQMICRLLSTVPPFENVKTVLINHQNTKINYKNPCNLN